MQTPNRIAVICLSTGLLSFPVLGDSTFAASRLSAALLPVVGAEFEYDIAAPSSMEPGRRGAQAPTDYQAWTAAQHRAAMDGGLFTRSLPEQICPVAPTASRAR